MSCLLTNGRDVSLGKDPKEVLTIFFYWDGARVLPSINAVKSTKGKSQYLNLTNDLFNLYENDPKLIPSIDL